MRTCRIEPAHVEERIVGGATYCDGCGANVHKGDWYERNEITIEARLGDVYPEGSHRTVHEVDACPKCFLERIVPALEAAGFKVRKRHEDGDDDGRVLEGAAT